MKKIVKAALAVAKKYPVFPTTQDKLPALSNEAASKLLGRTIAKGEGGFKLATQDPVIINKLFSVPQAATVSVPMGPMSGLLCIDPDLYKGQHVVDWHEKNRHWLEQTLCHQSQRGGLHYIFKWTDEIKFPATLAEGVDVKGHGGYIVFPPSGGYTVLQDRPIIDVPIEAVREAMVAKGGTGNVTMLSSFNDATDQDLIDRIQDASDLYPAIRTLSYRLPSRRQENGSRYTRDEMVNLLNNLMDTSVAADQSHSRHEDWLDRREKIEHLVETAMEKEAHLIPPISEDIASKVLGMKEFIDTQKLIGAASRPIGPQRETSSKDIERKITEMGTEAKKLGGNVTQPDFGSRNVSQLNAEIIPPIVWVIPDMIPEGGTVSLAGMSNVGKTRWLASLVVGLAVGDTARIGLPQCEAKVKTLWIANEEHEDDVWRRCKAVARQHGDVASEPITVRGKGAGMMRLVAINESKTLEVDEKNIAILVDEVRRCGAALLIFDPYVTLSDGGGDENSATSAAILTKAFLLIIKMTGVAIMHVHHTPKGSRQEDRDWPRGDSSAWRGSGAIYSALDCGFTLSNWMPYNKEKRKEWKGKYLEEKLSRWVVLDSGKVREGKPIDSAVYELIGQEMDKGEGRDIGVCHLSTEDEAENSLVFTNNDAARASLLGDDMVIALGFGRHTSMAAVAKLMKGNDLMPDLNQSAGKPKLYKLFEETVSCDGGYVTMIRSESGNKKAQWAIQIDKKEDGND